MAEEARRKLREKRLDLIVANDVTAPGAGFGSDTNVVRLLDAERPIESLPVLPKDEVAGRILDWVARRRRGARVARPPCAACAEPRLRRRTDRSALSSAATASGIWPRRLRLRSLRRSARRAREGLAPGRIGRLAGAPATAAPADRGCAPTQRPLKRSTSLGGSG